MKKTPYNSKPNNEAFNADNYLSTGIPKSEIIELKDAFDLIDSGSTGKLDPTCIPNLK